MKTLKITLVAIFSIALLTAVLPSSEIESPTETPNHEVKKPIMDKTVMIDKKNKNRPSQA